MDFLLEYPATTLWHVLAYKLCLHVPSGTHAYYFSSDSLDYLEAFYPEDLENFFSQKS